MLASVIFVLQSAPKSIFLYNFSRRNLFNRNQSFKKALLPTLRNTDKGKDVKRHMSHTININTGFLATVF